MPLAGGGSRGSLFFHFSEKKPVLRVYLNMLDREASIWYSLQFQEMKAAFGAFEAFESLIGTVSVVKLV